MTHKDIAFFIIAESIPDEVVNRFESCLEASKPSYNYDVYIIKGEKRTKQDQFKQFNKSKLLNGVLRKLLKKDYDVLIQTDVDVIVPPGLVDYSYNIAMSGEKYFHNDMVRIDPERDKDFKNLPTSYNNIDWEKYKKIMSSRWIDAAGCWNACQKDLWLKTGGWCEEFVSWSREDDYHREVVKKFTDLEIISSHKFPLLHYNHPPRTKDNRRQNDVVRTKYRKRGFKNWLM